MDLSTTYMGLALKNPIVAGASTLSEKLTNIRQMEDAGAGAVVLFSLFEEQVKQDHAILEDFLNRGADSFGEALSYFPEAQEFHLASDQYVRLVERATKAVDIPIIGSLNGISPEGWVTYAEAIESAGAKALELNIFYMPTSFDMAGTDVEATYLCALEAVRSKVDIPVALKLNPYFSSMPFMAQQFAEHGANGLVLFNRFYQPDFDIETLDVVANLHLSAPDEMRLPLLWIAILYGQVGCSLAATTGVDQAEHVVKYLLAGADVVQTASSLYRHGIDHLSTLRTELVEWMEEHGYESVRQMRGAMSRKSVADPTVFERANYIRVLESFNPETDRVTRR